MVEQAANALSIKKLIPRAGFLKHDHLTIEHDCFRKGDQNPFSGHQFDMERPERLTPRETAQGPLEAARVHEALSGIAREVSRTWSQR